jgi:hypothetical protein
MKAVCRIVYFLITEGATERRMIRVVARTHGAIAVVPGDAYGPYTVAVAVARSLCVLGDKL